MKKHFIRNRKLRYGGITAVLTALVIAVAVLANAVFSTLAERYGWYVDLLSEETFEVTEDCYAKLDSFFETLKTGDDAAKIEIIFCDTENNLLEEYTQELVYTTATSLAARFPEYITITCHDIWTNPNTVRAYRTTVDPLTGEISEKPIKSTDVIVVAQDYHRVYKLEEFYVFSTDGSSTPWAYAGEKTMTSALMKALDPEKSVACLTSNHGEIFFDYELLYLLDDAGYTVHYIDLYTDPIPENCTLLISYNPNSDLVQDEVSARSEVDILNEFLSKDGNSYFVFLGNANPSLPNFEAYLAEWGVSFGYHTDVESGKSFRYMVQDSAQSLTSDGYSIYGQTAATGRAAEIVSDIKGNVVFKNATAIKPAQGFVNNGDGSYTNGNRVIYSLYQGSDTAVSWANGIPVSNGNDMLMSLTEQTNAEATSYVGVISSIEFFEATFLQSAVYGNTNLMMRLFGTVGKTHTLEGLTIQPFSSTEISTITTAQMLQWTIVLATVPAVVVASVGVAVLVKRRRG